MGGCDHPASLCLCDLLHRSEAISVLQAAARTAAPTLQPLLQYNLAVLLAEAGSADQALKSARAALQGCSAATAATSAGVAGTTAATSAGSAVSVLEGEELQREAGAKRQQLATLCLVLLSLLTSARCVCLEGGIERGSRA